jgi:glycerophosphodiester phosphodiesterase
MKFGQNLSRNQVPEWASSYIDYKALKKLIKSAQWAIESEEDPDLAGIVSPAPTPVCLFNAL